MPVKMWMFANFVAVLDPGTHPDRSGAEFCSGMVVSDHTLVLSDINLAQFWTLGLVVSDLNLTQFWTLGLAWNRTATPCSGRPGT